MNNKKRIVILVLVVLAIGGMIWYLQSKKSVIMPSSAQDVQTTQQVTATPSGQNRQAILAAKAAKYPVAKELTGATGFINTPPFTLSSLIGKKVILIDFWTYSCINCQRTLPYLKAWYSRYESNGLVIIGVHTPEFDFEKNYNNVAAAVKAAGITYPVVLDSNDAIWNAYGNQYWPREYLIDIDGYIVHDHIGEGDYDVTEQAIQAALKERAQVLGVPYTAGDALTNPNNVISVNAAQVDSPETYFGSARNQYFINGSEGVNGLQNLTIPASTQPDYLYLGGPWNFSSEFAEAQGPATIDYTYSAKNVYMVASSDNGVTLKILLDGKPIDASVAGSDVASDGTVTVKENRLYSLVNGSGYGQHTLQIQVESTGLDAYTFTFG